MSNLSLPPVGATVTITETSAFSGVSPGAVWTDLDLSAIVGARVCLVLFEVLNNAGDASTIVFKFRRNGDTTEVVGGVGTSDNYPIADGATGMYWCYTDSNGIVEWQTNLAKNAGIWVEAFAY